MKDPKDSGTIDIEEEIEARASALKNENGDIQVPVKPEAFLNNIIIHAKDMSRDPAEIVQDIHDATAYWLQDRELRKEMGESAALNYTRGLN